MNHDTDPSDRQPPHRWTDFEKTTAITAIIGAVVVCASTVVTAYQAWLSQKALTDAAESRRAWLQISAEHIGSFKIDADGASIMVLPTVKNVGQTPALNVQRWVRLVSATDRQDRPCSETPTSDGGPTVFPGETIELLPMQPSVPSQDIRRMPSRGDEGAFMLLVCVSYQTGTADRRTTGSTYLVERTIGDRRTTLFSLEPREWPMDQVHIHRFAANDEAT